MNARARGPVEGSTLEAGVPSLKRAWPLLLAGSLAACASAPPPAEPQGPLDRPPLRTCNAYDYGSPIAGDPCVRPGEQWRMGPGPPLSDAGLDAGGLVPGPGAPR